MTLYLDRHDLAGTPFENATPAEMLYAHQCDLREQEQFGVQYLTYWWHEGAKTGFCLVEAPDREAAELVHRQAHGEIATRIIEVDWQSVEGFLGPIRIPRFDEERQDLSFRTILCARIEEPRANESANTSVAVSRAHGVARRQLKARAGLDVARSDGSLLGCFPSAVNALECALAIQRSFVPLTAFYQRTPVEARIGISAGEPVMSIAGIFGDAVQEASALCALARSGEVLVSAAVRDLVTRDGFEFESAAAARSAPAAFKLNGRTDVESTSQGRDGPREYAQVEGLSRREVEVLRLIARGKTNQEIAGNLFISANTVATHVRNILEKTESANRAESVSYALRHGLA